MEERDRKQPVTPSLFGTEAYGRTESQPLSARMVQDIAWRWLLLTEPRNAFLKSMEEEPVGNLLEDWRGSIQGHKLKCTGINKTIIQGLMTL